MLTDHQTPEIQQKVKLVNILLRPEISMEDIRGINEGLNELIESLPEEVRSDASVAAEISLKYKRYIEKEQDVANKILKFEEVALRPDIDYFSITALSYEAREKLTKFKPATIGQASRISGVSPADISVLLIYIQRT